MTANSSELTMSAGRSHRAEAFGLNLITRYKFAKSIIEFFVGGSFLVLGSAGLAEELTKAAQEIRHHAAEAWSIALAERLIHVSTAHNLFVIAVALVVDGLVTFVEGWALYCRYGWSRWLVVVTTSSLIPYEGVTLFLHPSWGRGLFLVANMLIVVYLVLSRASFAGRSA